MIAKLTGTIAEVGDDGLVLDVGGVGYFVSTIHNKGCREGSEISLHTYLAVRENALDLYGFRDKEELRMFYELNKIPKIGPKTALQILSQVDIATLKKAVATEDPRYLTKMSGIGKKSAEKIVLGLKDALKDEVLVEKKHVTDGSETDVIDALITLGYSHRDAREALKKIPDAITKTNDRIKHALKELMR